MSESRSSSESRSINTSNSTFYAYPGESRNPSESRESSENRVSTPSTSEKKYNNIESIDKLIESLEASIPNVDSTNPKLAKVIDERKQKIKELKDLREESIKKAAEDKIIKELESQNREVQKAIDGIKKYLKVKPTTTTATNDSSESRNSSESR